MERNFEQKDYGKLHYGSPELGSSRLGPSGQTIIQNQQSPDNMNVRPPESNGSTGVKPVLNYSIRTGEEFAFEFLKECASQRKQNVACGDGVQRIVSDNMDLKELLGISRTELNSKLGVSVPARRGTAKVKEFEKGDFKSGKKNYNESAQLAQHAPLGDGDIQAAGSYCNYSEVPGKSSMYMKFLCSFGGKILPRPSDGRLRYVGGDTRIVRIRKDISWRELNHKMLSLCNEVHIIKYQLPGEDLDALISVSSDEDLQNLMEEYSALEGGEGSQKLRLFLFSMSDLKGSQCDLSGMDGNPEAQYVFAINGMDVGSDESLGVPGLASLSTATVDHVFNHRGQKGFRGLQTDSAEDRSAPASEIVAPLIVNSSSLPAREGLSNGYGSCIHPFQDGTVHHVEGQPLECNSVSGPLAENMHNDVISNKLVPPSLPSHYGDSSLNAQIRETPASMPNNEVHSGYRLHDSELPMTEVGIESSLLQGEAEWILTSENETLSCMKLSNAPVDNLIPPEVPCVASVPDIGIPLPASEHLKMYPVLSEGFTTLDAVNSRTKGPDACDQFIASGGVYTRGHAEGSPTAFSYYDPPLPFQRVFFSERIPREQAELLNQSSKSDEFFSAQCQPTQSRPGLVPQKSITEDPLHEKNLASHAEQCVLPENSSSKRLPFTKDTLVPPEKHKEFVDAAIPERLESAKLCNQAHIVCGNETNVNPYLSEIVEASIISNVSKLKGPLKEPFLHELRSAGLEHPNSANRRTAATLQEKPVSRVPQQQVQIGTHIMAEENTLPLAHGGSSTGAVVGEECSFQDLTPERGHILIDINDRFSPNSFSDMLNDASACDLSTRLSLVGKNEATLGLNMQKNESKRSSFFRNLAEDEFAQNDTSLMNQDNIVFNSPPTRLEERATGTHVMSPPKGEVPDMVNVDSPIICNKDIRQTLLSLEAGVGPSDIPSIAVHAHSLDDVKEIVHLGDMPSPNMKEPSRAPDSVCEEGNLKVEPIGGIAGSSTGAFNVCDVQIIMNDDLEELKELGSGSYGTVYHGKWRGTDVAIKRIKNSCFTGQSSVQQRLNAEFWREAEILSKLHHPNVVAFYGVVQDGPGGTLATVTEFMVNGSLRHVLLQKDKFLDRHKRLIIAMDAAFGMEYLHSKNIVHFDLKCDNLLVNMRDPARPICKVGDFGLSKIKRNTLVSGGVRGTLPWMAPELLNGCSNKVSEKVDVFSFGIVMWEILTGDEPYANMHYGAIIGGIVNNTLRPPVPVWCDPGWRRLMEQCWAPDPLSRPSFTEIASRLRQMSLGTQIRGPHKW